MHRMMSGTGLVGSNRAAKIPYFGLAVSFAFCGAVRTRDDRFMEAAADVHVHVLHHLQPEVGNAPVGAMRN